MVVIKWQEDWYYCSYTVNGYARAVGYGKTIADAIMDCLRDKEIIIKLVNEIKDEDTVPY